MNKRIRYVLAGDGVWQSMQFIRSQSGDDYRIILEGSKAIIEKMGKGDKIQILAISPHKVKIAVKRRLIELGCEFEKEERKPKKSEVAT